MHTALAILPALAVSHVAVVLRAASVAILPCVAVWMCSRDLQIATAINRQRIHADTTCSIRHTLAVGDVGGDVILQLRRAVRALHCNHENAQLVHEIVVEHNPRTLAVVDIAAVILPCAVVLCDAIKGELPACVRLILHRARQDDVAVLELVAILEISVSQSVEILPIAIVMQMIFRPPIRHNVLETAEHIKHALIVDVANLVPWNEKVCVQNQKILWHDFLNEFMEIVEAAVEVPVDLHVEQVLVAIHDWRQRAFAIDGVEHFPKFPQRVRTRPCKGG